MERKQETHLFYYASLLYLNNCSWFSKAQLRCCLF